MTTIQVTTLGDFAQRGKQMTDERAQRGGSYPVLQGQTDEARNAYEKRTEYPRTVPWELVRDHDKQAQSNHSQTLERLAQRGGLSPLELWCVVNDMKWHQKGDMTEAKAIEWLRTVKGVEWKIPPRR